MNFISFLHTDPVRSYILGVAHATLTIFITVLLVLVSNYFLWIGFAFLSDATLVGLFLFFEILGLLGSALFMRRKLRTGSTPRIVFTGSLIVIMLFIFPMLVDLFAFDDTGTLTYVLPLLVFILGTYLIAKK